MRTYDVLSGTRYLVKADNEEQATQKLSAYWMGDDCPCGRPQWASDHAREIRERGEKVEDYLCVCVEEQEVDTDVQIVHVSAPEEAKTFVCPACKQTQPWDFGGAPCLACDDCHYTHNENGGDCING